MGRRTRQKAAVNAKAIHASELLMWLGTLFFFLLGAALLMSNARGATLEQQFAIEREVWTAEPDSLLAVDRAAVRLIQEDPGSAFAHYLVAKIYLRRFMADPSDLSLLRRASELGQQAIELDQANDYGYVVIAEILDIMGQPQNALKILDRSVNPLLKTSWRTYFTRARLNSDSFRNDLVLKLLDDAMAEPGAQGDVIAPYVVALLQDEYTEGLLLTKLDEWLTRHPNKYLLHAKGVALATMERYGEAHSVYQAIIRSDPTFAEAVVNDSVLLYMHLAKADSGRDQLERVLKVVPRGTSPAVMSVAASHLGLIYLQKKDFGAAGRHFIDAVMRSENHIEMVNAISQQYKKQGAHKNLAEFIRQLNETLPGMGLLHALLGETLSEDLHDHKSALTAFGNALALEPERSDYYNGMGLAYYRMNDLSQALYLFSTATKVDPQDATAKYNEACVLSRLGRPDEALVSLKDAITLDPRLTDSAREDRDFVTIKSLHQFEALTQVRPVPTRLDGPADGDAPLTTGH